ncbi:MAG TPA: hypothetical protein VFE13_00155 [Caulobacteraceae bacterium]|nr:hypothetical protein [Caulobacteraceae bacterium]
MVAPAVFRPDGLAPITGDFIVDLSAPRTTLHRTAVEMDGLGDGVTDPTAAQGTLRLAGLQVRGPVAVADLDARQWGFPTSLGGLIGADSLAGMAVRLSFAPCRVILARRLAPTKLGARLPIRLVGAVPTIEATVSDGATTRTGRFAIDTGSIGVRIAADAARFSRLSAKVDPLSRDAPPARLASLSFGGVTLRNEPAALATDLPDGVLGAIGTHVWSRYSLTLDLRRGELRLGPPSPQGGGK